MRWLKFSGAAVVKIVSGLVLLALASLAACALWFMTAGYQLATIDQTLLSDYDTQAEAIIVSDTQHLPMSGDTVGYAPYDSDDLVYAYVHKVHSQYLGQSDVVQTVPEITGADNELITASQVVHTVVTDAPIFGSTVAFAGIALKHPGAFWTVLILIGLAASAGVMVPARKHVTNSQPAHEEFDAYQIVDQLFPGVLINEFVSTWHRKSREFELFL